MKSNALWFDGKQRVEVREGELAEPGPGQVLVETRVSAISAGTELLFYRGKLPPGISVDAVLGLYSSPLSYPLRYGYACAGTVLRVGAGVDPSLRGRPVFAFAPHASVLVVSLSAVVPVPEGIGQEDSVFLASMETAVTLVLDGHPDLADRISVFGLGTIGLGVTGLLARFPLVRLRAFDFHPLRRQAAAEMGAAVADPRNAPPGQGTEDLVYELTGSPEALRGAVSAAAFSGLVVLGSWYGGTPFVERLAAPAQPDLGDGAHSTTFHRNRVRIVSSQVSTIDPSFSGRWDRERRFAAAWEAIRLLRPSRWVTQRVPFRKAGEAYRALAERPGESIQVLLTY